jgi:hypothetical protein
VQVQEGLHIANYSEATEMAIGALAAWPQNYMLPHRNCIQKQTVAVVAFAEKPDTVLDYMADELSASGEYSQVVVDTGLAVIGIGFEENAGGCKAPVGEGGIEGRLEKAGTDVDILKTPDPQMYFGLATEDCKGWLLDCL